MKTGWIGRLLAAAVLLAACRAAPETVVPPPAPTATSPAAVARDYWPTHGWRSAAPDSQGVDPAWLAKADSEISARLPDVYSLLVIRHGYLVYERYYAGSDEKAAFGLRSATKSFASAMIGIALRDGYLKSLDQKVSDLLPEYFTRPDDPRKKDITLRHLLTMSAGFAWDEMNAYLPITPGVPLAQSIVDLPLAADPGAQFNYSSPASHLLSVAFTRAVGHKMGDMAARDLFEPIGIPNTHWPADPEDNSLAYTGLVMPAREAAKLGFLYLNEGRWDGRQVIPADYVRESTRPQISSPAEGGAYGYLWWVATDRGYDAFLAAGYGGQYIYAVPALDLLVVMTGNPQASADQLKPSRYIIRDFILPAVRPDRASATR